MLTGQITDARAWTAATIDKSSYWYHPVPEVCSRAFERLRCDTRPLTDRRQTSVDHAACSEALEPVRRDLESGRGFAIIESTPLPSHDAKLLYWIVGQCLGQPFAQNVEGVMLYDVRDTGQDVAQGARFSVTNYESSFHTDNSFGTDVLDYVGLLCLQTAKTGGRSQVLSGYAVHNELLAHYRDALEVLYQPFHVDRRGGLRDGDAPTIQFPVIASSSLTPGPSPGGRGEKCELLFRYLRYWIEAGHEKIGQPLTSAQRHALDTLDACLAKPELRVEFDLKPGDMYFINNRWTLHNRTAFEDHAEPERRRHLVRLWLQA